MGRRRGFGRGGNGTTYLCRQFDDDESVQCKLAVFRERAELLLLRSECFNARPTGRALLRIRILWRWSAEFGSRIQQSTSLGDDVSELVVVDFQLRVGGLRAVKPWL